MKVIITENRIFSVAKKELTKHFGDLIPFQTKSYPNIVFYTDKNQKIYIQYIESFKKAGVDEIYSFLEDIFGFDEDQINEIMTEWFQEQYGLNVKRTIYANRDFWGWDGITNN
jgi:hypothetical protein